MHNDRRVDWSPQAGKVRSQGKSPVCWAFAVADCISTRYCQLYGESVMLSPQHLIDCSIISSTVNVPYEYLALRALKDMVREGRGIPREKDCQYLLNVKNKCQAPQSGWAVYGIKDVVLISKSEDQPWIEEDEVIDALSRGPVCASLERTPEFMRLRKDSGVYSGPRVARNVGATGHAVLITGYGYDEESEVCYYDVKNSWGTRWGNNGYGRVAVNTYADKTILHRFCYPVISGEIVYHL